ncbi:MAG: MFS transporter [Armatimonadetes bacterium]|nr:MFS transporter [Armatimonadota bacterium]
MESNYPRGTTERVTSPYGDRPLTFVEHLIISGFWFATNFHWGALLLILLPGDMKILAAEHKAQMLGLVTGLGAIPALIVPLISGAMSDRCTRREGRRKPYILTGVLLNVVGLAMMATSVLVLKSLYAYFLSYAIVQIGNNIASGAYMGVIPDVVRKSEHGKASGFMALMSQLGTLFGAIGIGMLIPSSATGLRYGVIAFILLAVGIVSYFGIKENRHTETQPFHLGDYIRSLWISPKDYPDFAWVWFTRFLVMVGFYSIMPFVNYYLVDVVGVAQDQVDKTAPLLLGLILIVSSITGIYGGAVSDRIGRKRVVYIANTIITVVAPAFIFCHNLSAALLVGGLFGLGYGAYISVDYALGTDVLPRQEEAGKDMAIWHIAMTLPQSIAAPIAGLLIALPGYTKEAPPKLGEEPIFHYLQQGYAYIFVLCALCFALGAYLLKNVKGVS